MAKKGKKNNRKNDYWDQEEANDAEVTGLDDSAATPEATDAGEPVEDAAEPSEPVQNDFMANLKRAKNKKAAKQKQEDEKKKKEKEQHKGPVIKSKKEKEREKKEREKERKRKLAEHRKQQQEQQKPKEEKKNKDESKKEAEEPKEVEEPKAQPAAKKGKKKGKKVPAALAALRKQLELQKQAEADAEKAEEEEKKRIEEEEKKREEEERQKEEAKKAKKEREKAKKEQLKKEGKYLTKKQKHERAVANRRRELLLQSSNISVAGVEEHDGVHRKVNYGSRKKNNRKKTEESTPEPAEAVKPVEKNVEKKPAPVEETVAAEGDDDALIEDWEKLAEEEGVAESWEDMLNDDAEAADELVEVETEVSAPATPASATSPTEPSSVSSPKKGEVKETKPAEKAAPVAKTAAKAAVKAEPSNTQKDAMKDLRSPICCILGHVDTGKTKLLDKIRQTNVQGGEAGGITQQIGATYFPVEALRQKTAVMSKYERLTYDVPGLLVIDTPGHESFTNLRSRGSSLCNIAILVVDIMHGLEKQTLESLRLLRERKAPFVVALNKIDRLYGWETIPNNAFRDSFTRQKSSVQNEFETRLSDIKLQLAEQGLNSELYFKNSNMARYVSIVPTSAVTGEGVPDLLWLLLELTQKRMSKQLRYLSDVQATILEVKVIEGLGTTIDVVLSNGVLHEGDRVVLCGMNGPIATNIRALLTPPPARELRIKSEYIHHKEVKAALGVKIAANDLEKAVAGSRLLVVGPDDDEDELMDEVMDDLTGLLDSVDPTGNGVVVQASTLGSLEALLDFLKDMKIPVMSIGLGPVYKRDVIKATMMLEKAPEFAVMLCFDVKIDKEAEQYAMQEGITIFNANVIYHLFDEFTAYQERLLEKKREENRDKAVFPCVMKTIQIINKRNPMIIGVDITEGVLKIGTPIGAVRMDPATSQKVKLPLGKVVSMEVNHESRVEIRKGDTNAGVAIRLEAGPSQPIWGRHVDENDPLYSMITRDTINTLKDPAFRSTVPREDWFLIKKLKGVLDIE